MKKTASLILLIFLTVTTFAQTKSGRDSDYRFAFVLSPQISWISSDDNNADGNGSLFGYNFGVEMDRFFAKNYAFSTGLTINTTGGKLEYTNPGNIAGAADDDFENTEYRLKYIEVPFRLKLQTNDFQRSSYYGVFGLSTQYNIKTNDGDGNSIDDEINFFNLGYNFGGGLQYQLGGDAYLKVGITYNQGITDVTDHKYIDDKATLNRLVFNFGIIF